MIQDYKKIKYKITNNKNIKSRNQIYISLLNKIIILSKKN